jgi:hypothetical protein
MDPRLYQKLHEHYYNPRTGFRSAQKIYRALKPENPTLTLKTVKEFVNAQSTHQVHQVKRNSTNDYNQTLPNGFGELCTDLLDLSIYKQYNNGFRYVLLVQDVYSRELFTMPLKSKNALDVLRAFYAIESNLKFKITSITADKGSEFNNERFRHFFKNVKLFFKDPELHNSALAITDRMCRTIRDILKKYLTAQNSFKWVAVVQDITDNINNSRNRIIKNTPESVYNATATNDQVIRKRPPQLEIGQKVRIRNYDTNAFNRKHVQTHSSEIFTITHYDGVGYRLLGRHRTYFYHELLPVNSGTSIHNMNSGLHRDNTLDRRLNSLARELG